MYRSGEEFHTMFAEKSHAAYISNHPAKFRQQPAAPQRATRENIGLASLRAVLGSLLVTLQGTQARTLSSVDAVTARTKRLALEANQQRF
jgi:hypothetical protein